MLWNEVKSLATKDHCFAMVFAMVEHLLIFDQLSCQITSLCHPCQNPPVLENFCWTLNLGHFSKFWCVLMFLKLRLLWQYLELWCWSISAFKLNKFIEWNHQWDTYHYFFTSCLLESLLENFIANVFNIYIYICLPQCVKETGKHEEMCRRLIIVSVSKFCKFRPFVWHSWFFSIAGDVKTLNGRHKI